jgi:hypothetical protein
MQKKLCVVKRYLGVTCACSNGLHANDFYRRDLLVLLNNNDSAKSPNKDFRKLDFPSREQAMCVTYDEDINLARL